jgi:hypothetical protein
VSVLFEVLTPLEKRIRLTKERWHLIVTEKHPSVRGREREVELALVDPFQVRRSKSDPQVHLYYRKIAALWLCVVVKCENGAGFIITAYFTEKIKEGEWLYGQN